MKRLLYTVTLILAVVSVPFTTTFAAENIFQRAAGLLSGNDNSTTLENVGGSEIADAFKQALSIASERVVSQLGTEDGFNGDAAIHIPLPSQLTRVRSALATVGMSATVDDLELRLNRAAEAATPIAKDLFLQSITEMNFADVMDIYNGPNDSATSYFRNTMSGSLSSQMRPIIDNSLQEIGALQLLDQITDRFQPLRMLPDLKSSLVDHVVENGMGGIFYYIAQQEAAIRENPARQTTELLKKVFGSN